MSNKTVFPYIPNSVPEIQAEMLAEVGASDVMDLYEEIPDNLRVKGELNLPEPIRDELGIKRHVEKILAKNKNCNEYDNFMGAGCAQHYVPAVCDEIAGRGELLTCYGAETWADHGKYQIFFEYQSMMAELLEMDFLTVPCHCGGQAVSTAFCMANRITGRKKILVPETMTPQNLLIAKNYVKSAIEENALTIETVKFDAVTGELDMGDLCAKLDEETAAVLLENPNYLGIIESQGAEIGKLAKEAGAEFIVYADPVTLGVMEAPANYGATICVGDLHGLGLHLHCGGAQAGYIACKDDMKYMMEFKELVDGIVETTVPGEVGYTVVLMERTHYAMREKGREFTGTQNNLWTAPVAVYLSLMGPQGMQELGNTIMTKCQYAAARFAEIPGISIKFTGPFFKEFVLDYTGTGKSVEAINRCLLEDKIFAGVSLKEEYPDLGECALICVTEMVTKEAIDHMAGSLHKVVRG